MVKRWERWLYEGPIGRWVDRHGAPPQWSIWLLAGVTFLLSVISILLSAGAFAR